MNNEEQLMYMWKMLGLGELVNVTLQHLSMWGQPVVKQKSGSGCTTEANLEIGMCGH